jgi:hypothetical protein
MRSTSFWLARRQGRTTITSPSANTSNPTGSAGTPCGGGCARRRRRTRISPIPIRKLIATVILRHNTYTAKLESWPGANSLKGSGSMKVAWKASYSWTLATVLVFFLLSSAERTGNFGVHFIVSFVFGFAVGYGLRDSRRPVDQSKP